MLASSDVDNNLRFEGLWSGREEGHFKSKLRISLNLAFKRENSQLFIITDDMEYGWGSHLILDMHRAVLSLQTDVNIAEVKLTLQKNAF